MITLDIHIRLVSDAEPGSGFGTEMVNDLVPRDGVGRPVIPGSHLKGLLREALQTMEETLDLPGDLVDCLFGAPGDPSSGGRQGVLRVPDAYVIPESVGNGGGVRLIARTALSKWGTVAPGTLRTAEAVAAGVEFRCKASVDAEPGSVLDLAARLAFLSVTAIGGGRTRGAGRCLIQIEGEQRTPGQLLRLLAKRRDETAGLRARPALSIPSAKKPPASKSVLLRLEFQSYDPVCCPETPVVANNVIRSGIVIPASAVQGALLSLLDRRDPELAAGCLEHDGFRCWPLLPVSLPEGSDEDIVHAVVVSMTHRHSKHPVTASGGYLFKDEAVEPYDWRTVPPEAPLKGSDGLLLVNSTGEVSLWRSGSIPRLVRSHSVHFDPEGSGERRFFTVEALAPMRFVGLVAAPEDVAEMLLAIAGEGTPAVFGRARTVNGGGTLRVCPVQGSVPNTADGRVFIVQSPVLLPQDIVRECRESVPNSVNARRAFRRVLEESGWPEGEVEIYGASVRVLFGWNRHGIGEFVGTTRRLKGEAVIAPGSVFRLKHAPEDPERLLIRGVGGGRRRGFGSVLPHPGIASEFFQPQPRLPEIQSRDEAGKLGLAFWDKANRKMGPSASQISAVLERAKRDVKSALDYLRGQYKRHARIWRRWEPVIDDVERSLQTHPKLTIRALAMWRDLAAVRHEREV